MKVGKGMLTHPFFRRCYEPFFANEVPNLTVFFLYARLDVLGNGFGEIKIREIHDGLVDVRVVEPRLLALYFFIYGLNLI